MNYEKKLYLAINRCQQTYLDNWKYFYSIYLFTTENIAGYIDYFDLNDKSLLTVGSSGDQILNAILKGCHNITLLDINPFVKYYYYLKASAILNLNIDEYLSFFKHKDYINKNAFNVNALNQVQETLKEINYESYLFWNHLSELCEPSAIKKQLFFFNECDTKRIIGSNPYLLNKENYELLKEKVSSIEPTFITKDIFKYNLNEKYDNIWLSNIAIYLTRYDTIDELLIKYYNLLNENGTILYSYLYQINDINNNYEKLNSSVYNLDYFFDKYQSFNPQLISFRGVYNLTNNTQKEKDGVLILKK